jgi:hypothetical protein
MLMGRSQHIWVLISRCCQPAVDDEEEKNRGVRRREKGGGREREKEKDQWEGMMTSRGVGEAREGGGILHMM